MSEELPTDIAPQVVEDTAPQDPFYLGLLWRDGTLYAKTGSYYNGQQITAENSLYGTTEMVLFSVEMDLPLEEATEIKPLLDLAFANIAIHCGQAHAVTDEGRVKDCAVFLRDGLDQLQQDGAMPPDTAGRIFTLLEKYKHAWPTDILGLYRVFSDGRKGSPNLGRTALE